MKGEETIKELVNLVNSVSTLENAYFKGWITPDDWTALTTWYREKAKELIESLKTEMIKESEEKVEKEVETEKKEEKVEEVK